MMAALVIMLLFRVMRLLSTGRHRLFQLDSAFYDELAVIVSFVLSALLFVSLFAIRRLAQRQADTTEALDRSTATAGERLSQLHAVIESMNDGLCIADRQGNIRIMNPAALKMNGFESFQEVPTNLAGYEALFELRDLDGNKLPLNEWPLARILRGERFTGLELTVLRTDTAVQKDVHYSGTSVKDAAGKLQLAVLTFYDATDRVAAARELSDSRRRLQSLFDTAQDAIFLTDDAGRYVDVNPAAAVLTGYEPGELLQRRVSDILPPAAAEQFSTEWAAFLDKGRDSGEVELLRKDGSHLSADFRAVANILPGLHLSVLRDVTDRRRFEATLRENSERLSLALEASQLGDWRWEPGDDRMQLSPRAAEIFGVLADPSPTRSAMRLMLPEPDRSRSKQASDDAIANHAAYDVEYRVDRPDGRQIWVAAKGRGQYDDQGRLVAMLGVVQDISSRKAVEAHREQLLERERAAREAAELNSRMKDEFLATLSHELRTPLTAILGWTHILQHDFTADDFHQGLQAIDRNAKAQTKIIEDLLDMSRIISGKIRLEVQRLDVCRVLAEAAETVKTGADAKGLSLDVRLPASAPAIWGDANRLQQVFWNLLSNAVKFSPRGSHVIGEVTVGRDGIRVRISDQGEGIDPAFLPFVFDRFRQADGSTTRRHGGLGLGLAIARQLVEAHGGQIEVQSEGTGRGATFTVTLPVGPSTASPGVSPDASPRSAEAAGNPIRPAIAKRLEGLSVLVVDDEADTRAFLQRLLLQTGAKVTAAGSAEDALEVLKSEPFDVLISDIGMPVRDGCWLMRQTRLASEGPNADIPAIALTAYARNEDRMATQAAGFNAHLTKPLDLEQLVSAIRSLSLVNPPVANLKSAPSAE